MEIEDSGEIPGRWDDVQQLLTRPSALAPSHFDPTAPLLEEMLAGVRVLVIGAGGLGCELLKDLSLSGFRTIDVIDMDTIDLSNLNRQFLFRTPDVGSYKADVAAAFVNKRVPGAKVTPHHCEIQKFDGDFYRQFNIIVCGLDSIIARRWINCMVHSLLRYDENGELDMSSIVPIIDGGTEGFMGSLKVIYPGLTPCYECGVGLYPPQTTFALCTIASTPRLPEHCIEYAKLIQWPQERPGDIVDGDDPECIKWLLDKAQKRAADFNIAGVTYQLTQGVVKNIIPAVASTNALVAGWCTTEAIKAVTSCLPSLVNEATFNDLMGIYTVTYPLEKKADCLVCGKECSLECKSTDTLTDIITYLKEKPQFQMKNPSITCNTGVKNRSLYMANPEVLRKATEKNLSMTLEELGIPPNQVLSVTDITVMAVSVRLVYV